MSLADPSLDITEGVNNTTPVNFRRIHDPPISTGGIESELCLGALNGLSAWTSVSEGTSKSGAPVAAVPWEGSFALFIADPQRGVYAIKATPGFGWEQVPGITTLPGAPVTALSVGDHFVLFMVDATGKILSTSGVPYQGWDPCTDSQSVTVAGQLATALVQPAENFDIFLADRTGDILQASVIEAVQQTVANFSFDDMIIIHTRSVFTDTDYITISIAVGDAPAISKTLEMGSLSPGNYPLDLSIQVGMPETPPTAVSFAWSVVNKGQVRLKQFVSLHGELAFHVGHVCERLHAPSLRHKAPQNSSNYTLGSRNRTSACLRSGPINPQHGSQPKTRLLRKQCSAK